MDEYIEREAVVHALCAEADKLKVGEADALAGLYTANCIIDGLPAAYVAPVRHGVPMLGVRKERFEVYDPAGMLNGKEVFKMRIITVENSSYMRCPFCGKRLCSRFFNYCPNCGAKMDGKGTEE